MVARSCVCFVSYSPNARRTVVVRKAEPAEFSTASACPLLAGHVVATINLLNGLVAHRTILGLRLLKILQKCHLFGVVAVIIILRTGATLMPYTVVEGAGLELALVACHEDAAAVLMAFDAVD